MKVPMGFELLNPALRGAYKKGYAAGVSGRDETTCPYGDIRKANGRLTWSRGFRAAWKDGWAEGRKYRIITAYYKDRAESGQSPLTARRP
jgi:ribosome modulation factor